MTRHWPAVVFCLAFVCVPAGALAHGGSGIALDEKGLVYFTDTKEGIWRIESDGKLTLVHAGGLHWMTIDLEGTFAQAEDRFGPFRRLSPRGQKPTLIDGGGNTCVMGKDGHIYHPKDHKLNIMRVAPNGKETMLVAREAFGIRPIGAPGIACGPDGTLYVVACYTNRQEAAAHYIYTVKMDGTIGLFARDFVKDRLPVADQHPESRPEYCRGLDVDQNGDVFLAVPGNRCVMKLTRSGEASVVLRAQKPWTVTSVAVRDGEVYVLEYDEETPVAHGDWPVRVRKLARDGKVTKLAQVRGAQ